jgi:membrane protein required for colicin V production
MSPPDVPIYDVVIAAMVAAFVVRGWMRGVLREALEIAVLLVGSFVVFRFSRLIGSIIAGMANIPYEVARITAGVILFLALVVGGALVARLLSISLKLVPGATLFNRLGGAVVGAGYAALVVVLGTTLLMAAPMSDGVRSTVAGSVGVSPVGSRIVEPAGVVQQTVSSVSGERLFSAVVVLREAVGARLVAGTLPVPLPNVGEAALPPSQIAAQGVFDSLNRSRILDGRDPLGWSGELAVVAVRRADQVYHSGTLALDSGLAAVLEAQGVPGTINAEMVVLAASTDGVAEAFVGATASRDAIFDTQYRKAGIGVIDGPYGLLAVLVLSG